MLIAMATYRPRDRFFQKAREKGLPSRAAFKIEELLDRYHLARPGARVVDLGCAPGGWLAILARAVGPRGKVVGVDLVQCRTPAGEVKIIVGDIREPAVRAGIITALGGSADLVTSDLAPKLSGIADRDQARMEELVDAALDFAAATLRLGGAMIAKVFMGAGFENFVKRFRRDFELVVITRTRASRPGSAELYVVARGFRAAAVHRSGQQPAQGTE